MRGAPRLSALAALASAGGATLCGGALTRVAAAEPSSPSSGAASSGAASSGAASSPSPSGAASSPSPSGSSDRHASDHGGAVAFAPAPPPSGRPRMTLALVQILSRHGDRTSINPLPSETREEWASLLPSDLALRRLATRAAPSPPDPILLDARRAESWHGQLTTKGVEQLANTGAMLRRWLVDEIALLPPTLESAVAADAVKLRATPTRRTVQSAQALVRGLYPPEPEPEPEPEEDPLRSAARPFLPIEVRHRFRESMFPNPGMRCARQMELVRGLDRDPAVVQSESDAWTSPRLRSVRADVHERNVEARRREAAAARAREAGTEGDEAAAATAEAAGAPAGAGEAMVADVREDGGERHARVRASGTNKGNEAAANKKDSSANNNDSSASSESASEWSPPPPRLPSATSVWEPLQARHNHGLPLPRGVSSEDLRLIRRAAEVRYVNRATNAEGAALSGGRLLKELGDEIAACVGGGVGVGGGAKRRPTPTEGATRLSVYSGHDSTIIALLAVLGSFGGEWPPVASTVVVETWVPETREKKEKAPVSSIPGRLMHRSKTRGGKTHWTRRAGYDGSKSVRSTEGPAEETQETAMVRVVFNGRVLDLEGCAGRDAVRDGGLCSLDAFRKMADARNPEDYEKACESKEKRGGFPEAKL